MFSLFRKNKKISSSASDYPLLTKQLPFSVKEAYNSMRTNLMFIMNQAERKQIVFTSAIPSDGKTTSSTNAAILFAQTGAKVLLIDADMRRPKIHRILNLNHIPGFSDVLAKLQSIDQCIQHSNVNNLDVLSAGTIPPNPSELLIGEQLDLLLMEASKKYDYVIIDAPPVKSATDATIIANKVLGAVIVVRSEYTQRPDVTDSIAAIESVGGKILGFVLNDVEELSTSASYKRYRYKYKKNDYYQNQPKQTND